MSAVVVGYVPRPEGRAALDAAIAEARSRSARLVVVNVTRGDSLVDPRFVQGEPLQQLQEELAALDVDAEIRQADSSGDIAEELSRVCDDADAELVVIGLRKRSQVGKLIMGSAAQRILLGVDRPILCVKA